MRIIFQASLEMSLILKRGGFSVARKVNSSFIITAAAAVKHLPLQRLSLYSECYYHDIHSNRSKMNQHIEITPQY